MHDLISEAQMETKVYTNQTSVFIVDFVKC